jgi:NADH-quinone oxidoreductase subunit K
MNSDRNRIGLYVGLGVLVAAFVGLLGVRVASSGATLPVDLSYGALTLSDLLFYGFAAMALAGATGVAFSKNIVYTAVGLLIALLGAGSLYVFLSADFVAVTQLLVYIGGVLVLVLFAARADDAHHRQRAAHALAAAVRGRLARPPRDADRRGRHRAQGAEAGGAGLKDPSRPAPSAAHGERMLHVGLQHFLVVGALLFSLGLLTVATRRNAVGVLMGVELILNGANVNFVAFNHYVTGGVSGQIFALFIIVLAAAEAAVGLAIVLAIFQTFRSIDVRLADTMRE